jgi:hypothetical protein
MNHIDISENATSWKHWQPMTRTQRVRLSFELHRAAAMMAFFAVGLFILYAVPTSLEAVLIVLIRHFKPSVTCGLVGDSTGYLVLFWLGYKRIASAVYLLSKAIEIALLVGHVISADTLLWVTDLLPATVCMSLLGGLVFFARENPFPE